MLAVAVVLAAAVAVGLAAAIAVVLAVAVVLAAAVAVVLAAAVVSHPLPGESGLTMAPITESVAKVAFKGSDSNHLSNT